MLSGLGLKAKILLLCIAMAGVSTIISVFAYRGFHGIQISNDRVVDGVAPNLELINSMGLNYRKLRIQILTLGLNGLSQKDADFSIKEANEAIVKYEENNRAYDAIPFVLGEKELYDNFNLRWKSFKEISEKIIVLSEKGKSEDHEAVMKLLYSDAPDTSILYNAAFDKILFFHKNNFKTYSDESKDISKQTNKLIILISIIGIIASLIVAFMFATKLSKTISKIVANLEGSAGNVAAAATQIASTSEELSQATTEQAASLQETSSSIEEISSMINANTVSAKNSATSSGISLVNAEKGKVVVTQMISAIEEINTSNNNIRMQVDVSNTEIEEIVRLIIEIGNKTKVINDIVFQTKLLSFNASVEAARAGENGRGFAVVAEEVGKLAAMSGAAAIEISTMLNNSVIKVEAIVKNSKEKVGKLITEGKINIDTGIRIANECGAVLNEIVASVASVSNSVSEISTASQEQAQGVQEITKAIAQLDQVTQENTANSAESANAAEALSQQAETL
ncbi:MAG: methyl-accepting chemotaxis protein, partial [Bacteriovorax sp.]|nr:methyl-accepting chemotaxis protein [Bacteriovorax sp.]